MRLGRLPAYTQFDGSELYCTFITSICRTPAAYTSTGATRPISPRHGPRSRKSDRRPALQQYRRLRERTGGRHHQPRRLSRPRLGAELRQRRHFPVQFGYRTTLQNDPYPRAYSFGGFYVTGTYADPLLNTAARTASWPAAHRRRITAEPVWIQGQQMIYRPDSPTAA